MLLDLKDKNGSAIKEDDILFDGIENYRIVYNMPTEEALLLNCFGYVHNITQETISTFEVIGQFTDYQYLFECD